MGSVKPVAQLDIIQKIPPIHVTFAILLALSVLTPVIIIVKNVQMDFFCKIQLVDHNVLIIFMELALPIIFVIIVIHSVITVLGQTIINVHSVLLDISTN